MSLLKSEDQYRIAEAYPSLEASLLSLLTSSQSCVCQSDYGTFSYYGIVVLDGRFVPGLLL